MPTEKTDAPSYEEVCHGGTGHAETVRVSYAPAILPLSFLLSLYFEAVDPTSVNRQGNDRGVQYRTGIYYTDDKDLPVIKRALEKLQSGLTKPVAIEVLPLNNYSPAEAYHQKYLDHNPSGYCHIGNDKFKKAAAAVYSPGNYERPDDKTLKQTLSPLQFDVTRHGTTEPPFKNEYWNHFHPGIYVDVTTGEPLFASSDKFDSGCGWPSFSKPLMPGVVLEKGRSLLWHDTHRGKKRRGRRPSRACV